MIIVYTITVRCICPGATDGPRCKLLSRHFPPWKQEDNTVASHVWLPALPTCHRLRLTLHVLTKKQNGLILYAEKNRGQFHNYFVLQLQNGKANLIVKSENISVSLVLQKFISDYKWHRLDLLWVNEVHNHVHIIMLKIVTLLIYTLTFYYQLHTLFNNHYNCCFWQSLSLVVDHCLDSGVDPLAPSGMETMTTMALAQLCRQAVKFSLDNGPLGWGSPLQLGGIPPWILEERSGQFSSRHDHHNNGWPKEQSSSDVEQTPFVGCIAHVRVNNKVNKYTVSIYEHSCIYT